MIVFFHFNTTWKYKFYRKNQNMKKSQRCQKLRHNLIIWT